ncbi:MAG: Holliday junction branch migration protein RuvA [Desulfovibrio sp.]|nr:Holliday junction branch migration protein RuvA [Desulfovibrio sp.]
MIGYLEGVLLQSYGSCCLLKTQSGVGYEVNIPVQMQAALPKNGEHLALYTSQIVREDAQELYGFGTFEERQTFEILITISKVGAKTALAILSVFRPKDLQNLVLEGDSTILTQVPGIGKKTAQHVFLELKDKLKIEPMDESGLLPSSNLRSIVDGLVGLGYSEQECLPIVRTILSTDPNLALSEALRLALKALSSRKEH